MDGKAAQSIGNQARPTKGGARGMGGAVAGHGIAVVADRGSSSVVHPQQRRKEGGGRDDISQRARGHTPTPFWGLGTRPRARGTFRHPHHVRDVALPLYTPSGAAGTFFGGPRAWLWVVLTALGRQ